MHRAYIKAAGAWDLITHDLSLRGSILYGSARSGYSNPKGGFQDLNDLRAVQLTLRFASKEDKNQREGGTFAGNTQTPGLRARTYMDVWPEHVCWITSHPAEPNQKGRKKKKTNGDGVGGGRDCFWGVFYCLLLCQQAAAYIRISISQAPRGLSWRNMPSSPAVPPPSPHPPPHGNSCGSCLGGRCAGPSPLHQRWPGGGRGSPPPPESRGASPLPQGEKPTTQDRSRVPPASPRQPERNAPAAHERQRRQPGLGPLRADSSRGRGAGAAGGRRAAWGREWGRASAGRAVTWGAGDAAVEQAPRQPRAGIPRTRPAPVSGPGAGGQRRMRKERGGGGGAHLSPPGPSWITWGQSPCAQTSPAGAARGARGLPRRAVRGGAAAAAAARSPRRLRRGAAGKVAAARLLPLLAELGWAGLAGLPALPPPPAPGGRADFTRRAGAAQGGCKTQYPGGRG